MSGSTKDDKLSLSSSAECMSLSDLSALVQNNYNEWFNISKENEKLKQELNSYKSICSSQKSEIDTLKKNFDINLSTISSQLHVLQKSLKKREKHIKKTIAEKDKVGLS